MTFSIPEEKQYDFAKRQMARVRKLAFISVGIISIWLFLNMDLEKFTVSSLGPFLILILFAFLLPYLFIFNYLNIAEAIHFSIGNDRIEERWSDKTLSTANKMSIERNKRKFNIKTNKTIDVSEIAKITFSEKEICIYTHSYNWFNGNGSITIPSEVKRYKKAYQEMEKISTTI